MFDRGSLLLFDPPQERFYREDVAMKYATVVVLALALALVAARPGEAPLGAKLSLDEPYELRD